MGLLAKKQIPVREYELTYLVGSGYTAAELSSIQDSIVTLIGKNGGEIIETQDWGKKPLAYKIKKDAKSCEEAVYTHLILKLPADKIDQVRKGVDFKREVLRSLLVIKK